MELHQPLTPKKKYRSDEEKRMLINNQASSGLTIKEYCNSHGIFPTQYYDWKRKLLPSKIEAEKPSHFVELTPPIHSNTMEILFPNGIKVSLPVGSTLSCELIKSIKAA